MQPEDFPHRNPFLPQNLQKLASPPLPQLLFDDRDQEGAISGAFQVRGKLGIAQEFLPFDDPCAEAVEPRVIANRDQQRSVRCLEDAIRDNRWMGIAVARRVLSLNQGLQAVVGGDSHTTIEEGKLYPPPLPGAATLIQRSEYRLCRILPCEQVDRSHAEL